MGQGPLWAKVPILIFLGFFKVRVKNSSPIPAKSDEIIVLSFILWPHGTLRNSEPDPAETQHAVRNRPWVPHAGGQDDGSLHKLPQINEF